MSKLHVQLFLSLIFMIFFFYFISLHCVKSVQIWVFSGPYLSVLSPNTGKYRPEKTPFGILFTQCILRQISSKHPSKTN